MPGAPGPRCGHRDAGKEARMPGRAPRARRSRRGNGVRPSPPPRLAPPRRLVLARESRSSAGLARAGERWANSDDAHTLLSEPVKNLGISRVRGRSQGWRPRSETGYVSERTRAPAMSRGSRDTTNQASARDAGVRRQACRGVAPHQGPGRDPPRGAQAPRRLFLLAPGGPDRTLCGGGAQRAASACAWTAPRAPAAATIAASVSGRSSITKWPAPSTRRTSSRGTCA